MWASLRCLIVCRAPRLRQPTFPFCTIEPNVGVITVPDERLTKLAELVHPGRIVPATCEIVDIAGLVKGASKGEGLGNKFLGNIRETDAIIHVLRCFEDENITHVDGTIDPIRDKEIIDTELQLKDLETIESRLAKTEKAAAAGNKDAKVEVTVLKAYKEVLDQGKNARIVEFESKDEQDAARNLFLLTAKPVLYVCNVERGRGQDGQRLHPAVEAIAIGRRCRIDDYRRQDRRGYCRTGVVRRQAAVPRGAGTGGERREPPHQESLRPAEPRDVHHRRRDGGEGLDLQERLEGTQCAGVIHTDFEKGFIRAEVIKYDDYIKYGSEAAVREAGKMGVEGKDYVVQDGDIMHFRFNV